MEAEKRWLGSSFWSGVEWAAQEPFGYIYIARLFIYLFFSAD